IDVEGNNFELFEDNTSVLATALTGKTYNDVVVLVNALPGWAMTVLEDSINFKADDIRRTGPRNVSWAVKTPAVDTYVGVGEPYKIYDITSTEKGLVQENQVISYIYNVNNYQATDDFKIIGTSAERPANPSKGYTFFDTTLNKPIYYNNNQWVD